MTINKSDNLDSIKLTSEVLKTCENKTISLNSITAGVTADIPVLLATLIVELYVSHLIKLPDETSTIHTIKNKVLLTSCKFLQGPNTLFIKGFIRKHIYYASKIHENLRYYKVDIPFECTTTIILNHSKALPISDTNDVNVKASSGNKLLYADELVFNQESIEFFNTQPFCELISSKITEHYKYIYENYNDHNIDPLDIKEIIEIDNNMAIMLEIQVLQNQQVCIKPYCTDRQEANSAIHKSSSNNKADMKNKPVLDNLHIESDDDNKLDLVDNANLENESTIFDKTDIKNKPTLDSLHNEFNYNDKLDLDYLLNFYCEPDDDKLYLVNNLNLENESKPYDSVQIDDKSNFNNLNLSSLFNKSNNDSKYDLKDKSNLENTSNIYNEPPINNKLDFLSLFSFFNRSNGSSNHDFKDTSNLQKKSTLYNKTPINNKSNFNNYNNRVNSRSSYSSYNYRSNTNKLLILILFIFILYNLNTQNSY